MLALPLFPMRYLAALLCLVFLASVPQRSEAQKEPVTVNVRLLEPHHPQSALLTTQGGEVPLFAGGDFEHAIARLQPGEQLTISIKNNEVLADLVSGGIHAQSLQLMPEDGAEVRFERINGLALPQARTYYGRVAIDRDPVSPTELRFINRLGLEDYVASVVAREYGFDDLEGAKAMAVAVRTYALRNIGRFGEDYDHVDYNRSQAYDGSSGVTETARRAARETEGEVLTYEGDLIEAVYSASSGGHTADNDAVWDSAPLPYLRGKADPYDAASPYARWQSTLKRQTLLDALSEAYGFLVSGIQVASQSSDGRVQEVELIGNSGPTRLVKASAFRLIIAQTFGEEALRSTLFEVERDGDQYVFSGRGYGHGVGMSQWGAHALAEQGRDYRDILAFYYTDVALQPYGGDHATPLTANAAEPEARASGSLDEPTQQQPPADTATQAPVVEAASQRGDDTATANTGEAIPTWSTLPGTVRARADKPRVGW